MSMPAPIAARQVRACGMMRRLAPVALAATLSACQGNAIKSNLFAAADHDRGERIEWSAARAAPEATIQLADASEPPLVPVPSERRVAAAASPVPPASSDGQQGDVAEVGRKLADPTSNVWALFTEFDWNFMQGKATTKYRHAQEILFQPVLPLPLTENTKLITRPVVPFASVPLPDGNGGFDRKTGLGDIQLPLLFVPKGFSAGDFSVTYGTGPTFVFPSATSDSLGADRWEAGPALVGVFKNEQITAGAMGQYWWSYAGGSPSTSHGSLLYFAFYNLPNAWQIGTNPTITYNDKSSSDNKWDVPIGITVAKTTKIGAVPVKFQLGAEYFVVNQEDYGSRFQIKLNIIPVIPALVKTPLL
ncbi:MAG: hypothetical protein P9C48_03530 [Defluviicoccus sp.]|nr:hypothetical protein [Defluviicoccus sp.]